MVVDEPEMGDIASCEDQGVDFEVDRQHRDVGQEASNEEPGGDAPEWTARDRRINRGLHLGRESGVIDVEG